MADAPRLMPLFVKLAGRRVVVVGGGEIAASRIIPLVDCGADVTVVAPGISPAVQRLGVRIVRRPFVPGDLDGAWFVVAAATPEVNREVAEAATRNRTFVNSVDDPANASAYACGVVRRGDVSIAISTNGHAPALAGLLREALDSLLPDDLDRWIVAARAARSKWHARGVPLAERRPLLLDALNALYRDRCSSTSENQDDTQGRPS